MNTAVAARIKDELLGKTVGDWHVTGLLGNGKSAVVLAAEKNGVLGAIKIFDPDLVKLSGKALQLARIEREVSLKGIQHPHLIEIYDGGECPNTGYLFVVMSRIDAPNLADALSDVPRDRIMELIFQVAVAAEFLESKGLVHRDIKPDNIVVLRDFSKAILLDLGVLRPTASSTLTNEESFLGTLQYSSPEFLFGKEEDTEGGWRAINFYQLGAVLHDLIMKKRIFNYAHPYARMVEAVKQDVPDVSAADVSPDLLLLCKNCLLKDPALRLKFVKWSSFTKGLTSSGSIFDAKERIRSLQAHAAEKRTAAADTDAESPARLRRNKLIQIQGQIQTLVRNELISSNLFPPLTMLELPVETNQAAQTVFLFNKSEEFGLKHYFGIALNLELIELEAPVIKLTSSIFFSKTNEAVGVHPDNRILVFENSLEPSILAENIKKLLYSALQVALQSPYNSQELSSNSVGLTLVLE